MAKISFASNAQKIIGDPNIFSLEVRIFHSVSLTATIVLFLEIFLNAYMGLFVLAMICIAFTVVSSLCYYLSRFQLKTKSSIRSFGVSANFIFLLNYFFNSGINGPSMIIFCMILLVTIVVVPKKELLFWVILNFLTVFGVLVLEYFHPQLMPDLYPNKLAKVIDFGITYVVAVVLISTIIVLMRTNYDNERSIGDAKNREIEKQNNQIVLQNSVLEKLNSEKAKLFSIVAHDIRSPLSSVLGYLEVLAEADLTQSENEIIKTQLLQVTKDTFEMLSNVLAWSKTQFKGANVDFVAVNVGDEMFGGLSLERAVALRKNITLEILIKDEVVVVADLNMFQLVIRNLVNNAIKFTPTGGTVTISVDKKSDCCLIRIKDNGIGIKKQDQEQLFNLTALSTFGTNNEKGVGLGLLLCKDFTELQGGKISYEDNDEVGSTFVVTFNLYKLGNAI